MAKFNSSYVYAFECHPLTFKNLVDNIVGTRANAYEIALSDASGQDTLYDYGGAGYINSLTPNARYAVRFDKRAAELSVATKTIDEFCTESAISKIDILKIDTEGHDFNVLKGAKKCYLIIRLPSFTLSLMIFSRFEC